MNFVTLETADQRPLLQERRTASRCTPRISIQAVVLTLAVAIFVAVPCLLLYSTHSTPIAYTTPFPRIIQLAALKRTAAADRRCVNTPVLAHVREFFQSDETPTRSTEIITALSQTMRNNRCARFVLVVSDPEYLRDIRPLQDQYDVDVDVWLTPAELTYDMLMLATQKTDPRGLFVISTADVVIPDTTPLLSACPKALADAANLMAVSRRDLGDPDCAKYKVVQSADVFIGNATMIDEFVLQNTRFSPRYWGVENVVMWALLHGQNTLYNLCPYMDVVHHHATRSAKISAGRIRINHGDNNSGNWRPDLSEICDINMLEQKYPKNH